MSGVARIPLHRHGLPDAAFAIVDVGDAENLGRWRWSLNGQGYAMGSPGLMHRFLLGLTKGDGCEVDHRDRDRLNNRRANLRLTTHSENMRNSVIGDRRVFHREEVRALREAGLHKREIAAATGLSYERVNRLLPGESDRTPMVWTQERLCEALRKFYRLHGRVPKQLELDGLDGRPWFSVFYRRFEGGFREAVQRAGLEYVDYRKQRVA